MFSLQPLLQLQVNLPRNHSDTQETWATYRFAVVCGMIYIVETEGGGGLETGLGGGGGVKNNHRT